MFWKFVHIMSPYYSTRIETHALLKTVLLHELHSVVKRLNATNLRVIKPYLTEKEPNKSCNSTKITIIIQTVKRFIRCSDENMCDLFSCYKDSAKAKQNKLEESSADERWLG